MTTMQLEYVVTVSIKQTSPNKRRKGKETSELKHGPYTAFLDWLLLALCHNTVMQQAYRVFRKQKVKQQ